MGFRFRCSLRPIHRCRDAHQATSEVGAFRTELDSQCAQLAKFPQWCLDGVWFLGHDLPINGFFIWFNRNMIWLLMDSPTIFMLGKSLDFSMDLTWENMGKHDIYIYSGWWFGTFFIFPYVGNNHPHWLIFFRGVQNTNQFLFPPMDWYNCFTLSPVVADEFHPLQVTGQCRKGAW